MKRKLFFNLSVAMLALAAGSCRPVKDAEPPYVDHGSAPSEAERVSGTVTFSEECGYSIQVVQGDVLRTYFPVNLDDKYKVDGMRVKFAFEQVNEKPPKECPDLIVISVSDFTPLR